MAFSIRMTSIKLKNFIGIYTGLSKKELYVDLSKLADKDIIIILGENGTGKSTFASVLHPLPGTTDKRNKFIREGKNGLKVVKYLRSDGVRFICKVVYTATATGHSTKGYFTRVTDEEEIELNPNGNISSYKDLLFSELGVSDAMLKLANQNDVCKGHVDMTSTERKVNMSSFLPEDIYTHYFTIADKYYKELKTKINILVESLGSLPDKEQIEANLDLVTEKINELVEKRDKTIGKIKELETKIEMLRREGDLDEKERKLIKSIVSFDKELVSISKIQKGIYEDKLKDIVDPDDNVSKIDKLIKRFDEEITNSNMTIALLKSNIVSQDKHRISIDNMIHSRRNTIKDIETNSSLDDVNTTIDKLEERTAYLKKEINEFNVTISKKVVISDGFLVTASRDVLISGIDIVKNIRDIISQIAESTYVNELEMAVETYLERDKTVKKLESLKSKYQESRVRYDKLKSRISELRSHEDLKNILEKRPSSCKIDDCPFIAKALQWTAMEAELIEIEKEFEKIVNQCANYSAEISELSSVIDIYGKIDNLVRYVNSCMSTIKRLPYHSIYDTPEELLKCIKNSNRLAKCEYLDPFIDAVEMRDELAKLKEVSLPNLYSERELLKDRSDILKSTIAEIKELTAERESLVKEVAELREKLKDAYEQLEIRTSIVGNLQMFNNNRIDYERIADERNKQSEELSRIQKLITEVEKYEDKVKEKKRKLKDIESSLKEPTKAREILKMQQMKRADYSAELVAVQEDLYKCEIIRDSLSVKGDGMPVDALELFMETVRENANTLLASTFNGALYLEEFEINSRDFIIPYKKNGDRGIDVSYASSSERSFISLCLTLAIIEEIVSNYGIVILDEIDRGFSDNNKYKFINILGNQIKRVGITQTFMITHNREYYDGYNLGYILFPGHSLDNYNEDEVIDVTEDYGEE